MSNMKFGMFYLAILTVAATSSPSLAKKAELTGVCACRKGNSVAAIYHATACVPATHQGCTAVKVLCVRDHSAQCAGEGGIITQSAVPCSGYNERC